MKFIPIKERGVVTLEPETYGKSVSGIPLEVWMPSAEVEFLIFAGIHGQEPESTLLLAKALRALAEPSPNCAVILAANPDGLLRGTRANIRGVDLNRNFPAKNWSETPVKDYWVKREAKEVDLKTGGSPGSEPETQALISLIEKINPQHVITIHGPLGCIDDPEMSEIGKWMEKRTGLELIPDIGYPVPGSFGSWAKERELHVITYELPTESIWDMFEKHLPVFEDLLVYGKKALDR
ncbi:MAG: murein tripeptide amidase MpaA [Deltaproteobacteria bacterium]|nr:murein tripeptide amidase MpaA [Deltaproteobacteria bacterium]